MLPMEFIRIMIAGVNQVEYIPVDLSKVTIGLETKK